MAGAIVINLLNNMEEEAKEENSRLMKELRDNINPFDLTNEQFIKVFCLSKEAVIYICDSLQCILQRKGRKGLSIETQVLAALRFFAIGSYQKGNDYLISVSQPGTSRAIKAVAMGITQLLANEWIKFPNTNEKRAALKERFQKERNFKGVIGCIDCTHVAIVRPTHHEESYLNHKGFHSINVQAIASHDLEILNINARFPGSVHDNFIWRYSAVSDFMQQFYDSGDRSTWLLGDAGYGLEPWLMTPITDAAAESAEARYTQCHTSTRNCIERSFGLLKNVWRCLLSHRVLHYAPIMASNIIIACAVLHNIRLSYNLIDKEYDINEESEAAAVQRAALQQNIEAHNRVRALEIAGADEGKRCTWTRCIWTQPITAPCD